MTEQLNLPDVTNLPCPECDSQLELRKSRYGLFYGCKRYPDCDATHGANPDGSPKGIPADRYTRMARIRAHECFDRLWQFAPDFYDIAETGEERERVEGRIRGIARARCYRWLEDQMGLKPGSRSHIGSMDLEQCRRVIQVCRGVKYSDIRDWYKENQNG